MAAVPAMSDTGRVTSAAQVQSPPFGSLMREWRQRRRLSQLDLAIEADVSARHVSGVFKGSLQHCLVIRSSVDHAGARLGCPSRAFCVGGR